MNELFDKRFKSPDFACLDYTTGIWTSVWGTPQGWMKNNGYAVEDYLPIAPNDPTDDSELMLGSTLADEKRERDRWAVFQPQFPAFSPCLFHNIPSQRDAEALVTALMALSQVEPRFAPNQGVNSLLKKADALMSALAAVARLQPPKFKSRKEG